MNLSTRIGLVIVRIAAEFTSVASSLLNKVDKVTNERLINASEIVKLSNIETNADVTDTLNVRSAGAMMDDEIANLTQVKSFNEDNYIKYTNGSSGSDFDTFTVNGIKRGTGTINNPFFAHSTLFSAFEDNTGNYGFQLASNTSNSDSKLAFRSKGTAFSNWNEIYHTGNLNSSVFATAAQGNTADTALQPGDIKPTIEKLITKGSVYFNDFDGFLEIGTPDQYFTNTSKDGGSLQLDQDFSEQEDDILVLNSGTLIGGTSKFHNSALTSANFKQISYRARVRIPQIGAKGKHFVFIFGRTDSQLIQYMGKGFGFVYDTQGNFLNDTSNWQVFTKEGVNINITDTGIGMNTGLYVELRIEYTPSSISFYINNSSAFTITEDIYTGAMEDSIQLQKMQTGSNSEKVYVDYYSRVETKITSRTFNT